MSIKNTSQSTENAKYFTQSNSTFTNPAPVYHKSIPTAIENPFERLNVQLSDIKMMLQQLLSEKEKPVDKSDLIDIHELGTLLNISPSTIYKMTAKKEIPFFKREGSKKLIFSRIVIDSWVKKTNAPKWDKVDEYLHKNLRVRKSQYN